MDSETPGIELALLEGMSDTLLLKLKRAGIATRREFQEATVTPEARAELAKRVGIPPLHLDALHELNFVLPEERVARTLQHERSLRQAMMDMRSSERRLRLVAWGALATAAVALVLFVVAGLNGDPSGSAARVGSGGGAQPAWSESLAVLRGRLDQLRPLAANQSRLRLAASVSDLPPAPGWNGMALWTAEDHRTLDWAIGDDAPDLPVRALSLTLLRLSDLEAVGRWSEPVLERAREAASLADAFPPVPAGGSEWEVAAAAVRLRLISRARGLAPVDPRIPGAMTPAGLSLPRGFWPGHPFAPCEALLAAMEGLPLNAEAKPLWIDGLRELKMQASAGRDALWPAPEAWAREVWVLRGELELAVAGTLAGWDTLSPYYGGPPAGLLAARRGYLNKAVDASPPQARALLAWVRVAWLEMETFLSWLDTSGFSEPVSELPLVAAMAVATESYGAAPQALEARVSGALAAESFTPDDPFAHPRTQWAAGLSPFLPATRRLALEQAGVSPPDAP